MATLNVYLDGTIYDEVTGLDEFTEAIERDDAVGGIIFKYDSKLTFTGAGYAYLKSIFDSAGFCNSVALKIESECADGSGFETVMNGIIFIADIEFDLNKCTAACAIEDDSYSARIFNNRKIKVNLDSELSKNGVTIVPAANFALTLYNPATGVNGGGFAHAGTRKAYDIEDVFRFLIHYVTDKTVNFRSDFISGLADDEKLCFVDGYELRNGGSVRAPSISFEETFANIRKKYNLFFYIERTGVNKTLRIEDESFFFGAPDMATFDYIPSLKQSVDTSKLYSSIDVGSATISEYQNTPPPNHSLPPFSAITFEKENYSLNGNCNIDNVLDLISTFIIDSNTIQESLINDNKDWDKNTFMIQYVGSTSVAHKGYYITDGISVLPALYNEQLLNIHVLERYRINGDAIIYNGNGNDTFKAHTSSDFGSSVSFLWSPFPFETEDSDVNNNYNNATYRFTCPIGGDGTYRIAAIFNFFITQDYTGEFYFANRLKRYDSANNLLQTIENVSSHYGPGVGRLNNSFDTSIGNVFFLQAGDYVIAEFEFFVVSAQAIINFRSVSPSEFKCSAVNNGGGVFISGDSAVYFSSILEYEYPISNSIFADMKAQPYRSILSNHDGGKNKRGFIKRITRNLKTSMAEIQLITNTNNL